MSDPVIPSFGTGQVLTATTLNTAFTNETTIVHNETTRAEAAENTNAANISTTSSLLATEGARAISAEGVLLSDVNAEATRAESVEQALNITLNQVTGTNGSNYVGDNQGIIGGSTLWTTVKGFIQYLVSSAGSSVIGFIQSGTGVVARSVQSKLRDTVSVNDFGAVGDGVADDSVAINAAHAYGKTVYYPTGNYNIGSTSINAVMNGFGMVGDGPALTLITYSGTGIAIDGYGGANMRFQGFSVNVTNDAAIGIRLGNAGLWIEIDDVRLYGNSTATNVGTGLLLESAHVATAFSGGLSTNLFYVLGFKKGIAYIGDATLSNRTWTTCSFNQTFLVGRSAGIVAGSVGFDIDQYTILSGSTFTGGTVESFATGFNQTLSFHPSSSGVEWNADIEACTVPYSIGTNFQGCINLSPSAQRYSQTVNATANVWTKTLEDNGHRIIESYYGQESVIYNSGGWTGYSGVSIINSGRYAGGGAPTQVWNFSQSGALLTAGSITANGTTIKQSSTVGTVTVTSVGAKTSFPIQNGKTMKFSPYFGSLFVITIGATGEAGVFMASYASATITAIGPLPGSIELSATPATGHIGLTKAGGANAISVVAGATAGSTLTNMSICILGSGQDYSTPVDWV